MFCIVNLSGDLPLGTVVQFDTVNNVWTTATAHNDLIGVISQAPQQNEDDLTWWAHVVFAGVTQALAHEAIPDQGGELSINNGKVLVDNTADGCGIIAPLARGQASRVANDLVMVHIR